MTVGVLSCRERLFFARPRRDAVASHNMPHTDNGVIFHLLQSLTIAILAAGLVIAFGMGIGVCTMHVVVRHGKVTSVRDVVFMSFYLCSLWFDSFAIR